MSQIQGIDLSSHGLTLYYQLGPVGETSYRGYIVRGSTGDHESALTQLQFLKTPTSWRRDGAELTLSDFQKEFPGARLIDRRKAECELRIVKGVSLSAYGLKLMLTNEPDPDRAKTAPYRDTIIGGNTESHSVALEAIGFQRHPDQAGFWYRSGQIAIGPLKAHFPRFAILDLEEDRYIIRLKTKPSANAVQSPQPLMREPDTSTALVVHPDPVLITDVAGTTTVAADDAPVRIVQEQVPVVENPATSIVRLPSLPHQEFYRPQAEGNFAQLKSTGQANANLAAIRLIHEIRSTPDIVLADSDRETLSRYAGWGGLADVFDETKYPLSDQRKELKELTTPDEYRELSESCLNAHFTPQALMREIWTAVKRMGFDGGRLLEAGCGTGHFIGTMPDELRPKTQSIGVEKEVYSAAIAQALYGNGVTKIHHCDYQNAAIRDNSCDLNIGNVPFGNYRIRDSENGSHFVHDFFLLKNMRKLRPGGVMCVITSIGTLDKQNASMRKRLYADSDLIAAFRLPSQTQASTANCTVSTDLLVFRKRIPGEALGPDDWLKANTIDANKLTSKCSEGQYDVTINALYQPGGRGIILGEWDFNHQYASPRAFVSLPRGQDLEAAFSRIPANVPSGIMVTRQELKVQLAVEAVEKDNRVTTAVRVDAFGRNQSGHLVIVNKQLMQIEPVQASEESHLVEARGRTINVVFTPVLNVTAARYARVEAFIAIRDGLLDTLSAQQRGVSDDLLAPLQARALMAFNAFIDKFGSLHLPKNRQAFEEDPDASLVLASEYYDPLKTPSSRPSEVYSERTIGKLEDVNAVITPLEAVLLSTAKERHINTEYVSKRSGMDWAAARASLGNNALYDAQDGKFKLGAIVISGNVRERLMLTQAAIESDDGGDPGVLIELKRSLNALTEVVPPLLTIDAIPLRLGAPWIPTRHLEKFLQEIIYEGNFSDANVQNSYGGNWVITTKSKYVPSSRWDSRDLKAYKFIEKIANCEVLKEYDSVEIEGREIKILNVEKTELANFRKGQICDLWQDWLVQDPIRVIKLEAIYNARYNSYAPVNCHGLKIHIEGAALNRPLRDLQHSGIIRNIIQKNTLQGHKPGYGKTAIAISTAMLEKQLGLVRKTLMCVRKSTVGQFISETRRFFPEARILALEASEFNPKNRVAMLRKIQVQNPDIILVTPEQLKRIKVPEWFEIAYIQSELDDLEESLQLEKEQILARGDKPGRGRTHKAIQERVIKAKSRLEDLLSGEGKDDVRASLEDLGIGSIHVDEAHYFKAIPIRTNQEILGIPTNVSQRATDLLMKTRYFQEKGQLVSFMTGTFVANSLAEAFVFQKYLQPELLAEMGVGDFDAWCRVFADTVTKLEPDPSSSGYRPVTRLASIQAVPELIRCLTQMVETVSPSKAGLILPKVKHHAMAVPATPLQLGFRELLGVRTRCVRLGVRKSDDGKGDDNILTILGDAARGSLDLKSLFPRLPEMVKSGNKLTEVAAKIAEIDAQGQSLKTIYTQLVFCDIGTPSAKSSSHRFNSYEALREMLIGHGFKPSEIAFIHDFKTVESREQMFNRVRLGTIKVLMGSTEKMGEGVNVQRHLKALHRLTVPWNPAAVHQQDGRIDRQGNQHKEVDIYNWVTESILEDWRWSLVNTKAQFIDQIYGALANDGKIEDLKRTFVEDGSAINFGELEAMASKNPLVKEKAELESQISQSMRMCNALSMRIRGHRSDISNRESIVNDVNRQINGAESDSAYLKTAFNRIEDIQFKDIVLENSESKWSDIIGDIIKTNSYNAKSSLIGKLGPFSVLSYTDRNACYLYLSNDPDILKRDFYYSKPTGFAEIILNPTKEVSVITRQLRKNFIQVVDHPGQLTQRKHESMAVIATCKKSMAEDIELLNVKKAFLLEKQSRFVVIDAELKLTARPAGEMDSAALAFVTQMGEYGYRKEDLMKPNVHLSEDEAESNDLDDDDDEIESDHDHQPDCALGS